VNYTVFRKKNIHSHFLSYIYESFVDLNNQTVNDGVAHSRIGTLDQPVAA